MRQLTDRISVKKSKLWQINTCFFFSLKLKEQELKSIDVLLTSSVPFIVEQALLTRLVLVQSFRGLGTGWEDELEGFDRLSGGGSEVGAAGGNAGAAAELSGRGGGGNGG